MTKLKKVLIGLGFSLVLFGSSLVAYSANSIQYAPDLYPISDSKYYLGTTTKAWLNVITKQICLNGSCKTSWPTGGGSASTTITVLGTSNDGPFTFATGTPSTGLFLSLTSDGAGTITWNPQLVSGYSIPLTASTTEWSTALLTKLSTTTAAATYEPILTKGNLTATSPLQFDNTRQVIGGAAVISVATGYNIPLSASTTEWTNFYNTPSTRITAGNNLSWSGNTLNGISSSTIWGLFSASNPITYNSGTGAIGWTNSNNYITLGSLSGTSPINYNNGTGAISLTGIVPVANGGTGSSSLNTTLVSEGTNLYYTDARARGSISASASPITYDSSTGKIGFTNPGYISGNQTITLSGDITGSGATSITTSYNGIVPISKGGTATSTAPSASAVLLGNGTNYDYSVIPSCSNTTTSKLLYNNSTRQFSCGTDQTGSGGGATTTITSNIQSDGPNFTFATGTATGIGLNVSGSGATITFTPTVSTNYVIPLSASTTEWSGFYNSPSTRITAGSGLSWSGNTLSNAMASSTIIAGGTATHSPSVTFATTTDTNILLSIVCGTSTCTFNPSWTGTLADGRIASATTWNNKLSAYNVISANGLISVSTTTALATLTASTSPTFTYVGATNASTTNLSVATDTYLTNVANCTNGIITGAGGKIACNGSAFLTSAITSLNGLTGASQTFATNTTATGLTQTITSVGTAHTWNLSLTAGYSIPLTASTTEWGKLTTYDKSFNLSSTTPDYLGSSFSTATYTVPSIYNPSKAVTLVKLYCKTNTGTVLLNFASNLLSCTSSGASSTPSTNIAAEGTTAVSVGTGASSPGWVTVTATFRNQ